MKALATMGTGPMQSILDITLPTFRAFAERHDYAIVIGDHRVEERPLNWSKIVFLRELLPDYERVFYVDADAAILDPSVDPFSSIPETAFQALVLQEGGFPNAGVWALRRTEKAFAFLDAVWEQEVFIDHRWWEQAAIVHLLGFRTERPYGPSSPTEWTRSTHWLGPEWNSLVLFEGLVPCRIRHYAGYPNSYRRRRLKLDVASVRAVIEPGRRSARVRPQLSIRWHALAEATVGRPHTWKRGRLKRRIRGHLVRVPGARPLYRALRRLAGH